MSFERYEYRLVEMPHKRRRKAKSNPGTDRFAATVVDEMNYHARHGWQFVGKEGMTESRRIALLWKTHAYREYLVFRRQLRANDKTLDEPVVPRRVRPQAETRSTEELRARAAQVAARGRLQAVT